MDPENEGLEAPVDETIVDTGVIDEPVVETPVVDEPVVNDKPATMEETIRAKFKELNAQPDENANKPGWIKDPKSGRFVEPTKAQKAAAAAAKAAVAKVGADGKPVVETVAKPAVDGKNVAKVGADGKTIVAPPADPALDKPPTSWKPSEQAKFAALDPELKAAIHRREADFHKGIESYKAYADLGRQFDTEFQPYVSMIRAGGYTPQTLVKNWLNTEYQLKTGTPEQKAALFAQYAGVYGIDMTAIQAAHAKIAAGQPAVAPVDPRVAALEQRLAQTETVLTTQQRAAAEQQYNGIVSETEAFGQRPENKHFQAVKLQMADLMTAGQAESLQDAYNKAIWLNPEVRELILSEQAELKRKQAADKAAAARKAAGANVATRGTLPSAPAKAVSGTTIEDTIRANYRAIQARSAS